MAGQPPLEIDVSSLPRDAVVADIVYRPLQTALLRAAAAHGHATVDGLGMFMHQAAAAFALFYGPRPAVTPALREFLERELQR